MTTPASSSDTPVWFITGVSSGLGYALALAVLSSGHRVIGTVRTLTPTNPAAATSISKLLSLGAHLIALDLSHSTNTLATHALAALSPFNGRLDVLVNNAGFAVIGPVETLPETAAQEQLTTNFFAPLALTRALLPTLRAQAATGTGAAVVNVSSVAGFDGLPSSALYAASKFALEGLSEGLAREVGPLGVATLIVEPGAFRTKFIGNIDFTSGGNGTGGEAAAGEKDLISEPYRGGPADQMMQKLRALGGNQQGDPDKAARVIIDQVVGAMKAGKANVDARRVLLGSDAVARLRYKLGQLERDLAAGEEVARSTDYAV